jgi:hypothetical protein
LLDELFEHPAGYSPIVPDARTIEFLSAPKWFFSILLEFCMYSIRISWEGFMKRIQRYVLGVAVVLALAGCSPHHHHGMASEGKGGAY